MKAVFSLLKVSYLGYNAFCIYVLATCQILNKKQKQAGFIFIWLIPFLWYVLYRSLTSDKIGTMTKEKREELIIRDTSWGENEAGGYY